MTQIKQAQAHVRDKDEPYSSSIKSSQNEDSRTKSSDGSRKLKTLTWATIVIVVIFALALGIGLGVGLNHSKHSKLASSPSSGSSGARGSAQASIEVPDWRSNVNEYNLDIAGWDFNAAPRTRSYNFTLSEFTLAPNGVSRTVLTINGKFPGPVIRANRGDRLLVRVENKMSNATSIHWHGLFQNGTNWMDGTTGITQCPIPAGGSFLYNFTLDNQFGTYWYHAHYTAQNTDGLVGPLIVHAPEEKQTQELYDYDQVVLVSDWYHDLSSALMPAYLSSGAENNEPIPDGGLIQGTNYFNCSSLAENSVAGYSCSDNSSRAVLEVRPNKRYRYRLINTGAFAMFEFSIDNHTLNVIEADATAIKPFAVHRLEIAVAQRYSFIVSANQSANSNFWIRAQMNTFCFAEENPILDTSVRALLTYTNSTDEPTDSSDWRDALDVLCKDLNSSLLVPTSRAEAPPATQLYAITSSFQIGAYALDRAFINGTSWRMYPQNPTLNQAVTGLKSSNASLVSAFNQNGVSSAFSVPDQYVISIPKYEVVDLLISNFDDGAHPFHLHGHVFWVLDTSDQQYFDWSSYQSKYNRTLENPMRRDTVTVGAYGWALIRFRADNPGLWAFHCHISWHMEAGLLMQFQTRSDLMKDWVLPDDVKALCKAGSS